MFWKGIQAVQKEVQEIRSFIGELNTKYFDLNEKIDAVQSSNIKLFQETNRRITDMYSMVNDKIALEREATTNLIIKLEKEISDKMSGLSNRPIITDLLQKIAKLEAISDAIEARVPTIEILNKIDYLNKEMLRLDKEEKNFLLVKAQLDILKWSLGDQCIN